MTQPLGAAAPNRASKPPAGLPKQVIYPTFWRLMFMISVRGSPASLVDNVDYTRLIEQQDVSSPNRRRTAVFWSRHTCSSQLSRGQTFAASATESP